MERKRIRTRKMRRMVRMCGMMSSLQNLGGQWVVSPGRVSEQQLSPTPRASIEGGSWTELGWMVWGTIGIWMVRGCRKRLEEGWKEERRMPGASRDAKKGGMTCEMIKTNSSPEQLFSQQEPNNSCRTSTPSQPTSGLDHLRELFPDISEEDENPWMDQTDNKVIRRLDQQRPPRPSRRTLKALGITPDNSSSSEESFASAQEEIQEQQEVEEQTNENFPGLSEVDTEETSPRASPVLGSLERIGLFTGSIQPLLIYGPGTPLYDLTQRLSHPKPTETFRPSRHRHLFSVGETLFSRHPRDSSTSSSSTGTTDDEEEFKESRPSPIKMTGIRTSVQDAMFAECKFYGFHLDSTKIAATPATNPITMIYPQLTDALKEDAKERFEDFLMDVDVCASMVLPPSHNTRPEVVARAKVSTFVSGLTDEAKDYYDTLDQSVKRDFSQLVLKFQQRYVDTSEDEADRRRLTLDKYKTSCVQKDKNIMQYMAEGIYYYEQVDDRFKCTSPSAVDHIERWFVDGFDDQGLKDAIWAYLVTNTRIRSFRPKELVEVVKQLRYRQWNSEEYSKQVENLKTARLTDSRPPQPSEDVKTLVKMSQGFMSSMTTVNQNLSKVTDKLAGLNLAGTSTMSNASAQDTNNGYGRGQPQGRGYGGNNRGGYTNPNWIPQGAGRGQGGKQTCWHCGEPGHYANDCKNRTQREVVANQAEVVIESYEEKFRGFDEEDDMVRICDSQMLEVVGDPIIDWPEDLKTQVEVAAVIGGPISGDKRPREEGSQRSTPSGTQPVPPTRRVNQVFESARRALEAGADKQPRVEEIEDTEMEEVPRRKIAPKQTKGRGPRRGVTVEEADDDDDAALIQRMAELRKREAWVRKEKEYIAERQNRATASTQRKANKHDKPQRAPIRMLGDNKQLDIADIFNQLKWRDGHQDSEISVAQMIDSNPHFRQQIIWYLRSQFPRRRTRGKDGTESFMMTVEPQPDREAHPEPSGSIGDIKNFYTTAMVRLDDGKMAELRKVLLDAGSMINIVNKRVVAKLDLRMMRVSNLVMRTVTDQLISLEWVCLMTCRIAGVWCTFLAYVSPTETSYSLLLSRRFLYQVQATADYRAQTYVIRCNKGIPAVVPRSEFSPASTIRGDELPVQVYRTQVDQSLLQASMHDDQEFVTDEMLQKEKEACEDDLARKLAERVRLERQRRSRSTMAHDGSESDDEELRWADDSDSSDDTPESSGNE
ncbi:hypothetical protein BJ508DRAFT_334400 [Ascobolus immersus RN42]|uniref:CCHC-type domain-containing protein n=1 Tax=Ascobolus immersus RN42 TaxID=1160509 RepID=A0A3N4HG85_ASCIM|nr:hypothetical protein BJ508DRAFT_334400 [Ascobolus immersus RN42]